MNKGSLRHALMRHLLLSFNLIVLFLLPVIYFIFSSSVREAYDQELSEAAFSLVTYFHNAETQPRFDMPAEAEAAFRSDAYNKNYFLVTDKAGNYLAGDRDLPLEAPEKVTGRPTLYRFYDAAYRSADVRACVYRYDAGGKTYLFVAAETLEKRTRMNLKIVLGLILPLFALVLINGLGIFLAIRVALRPIESIRKSLQDMKGDTLHPLSIEQAPDEIRLLVQEFNRLLAQAEASAEIQQQFVANAAHQLRTPLAGVRAQLESMRDEFDDAAQKQRLQQCVVSMEKLNHLIHQMLALISAAPGSRETHRNAHVDVVEIIQDRLPDWLRQAAQKKIDLGCELAPLTVCADPLLIGEMIGNLVDNALKFAPQGGLVTLRCRTENHQGILEIEDNGPGIPPAERERVFQRFYRAAAASVPGNGLGLAIVHDIVVSLRGRIVVANASADSGCLMRVTLPIVAVSG